MPIAARRRALARSIATVTALVTAAVGWTALDPPAQAANRVTPGHFTGYGFDQCVTPSQEAMDAWLHHSPYWAVGVYIAGDNRACGDSVQTELTPTWVETQLRNGWRVLPITVGPQAPCYVNPKKKVRISNDPAGDYLAARVQGRAEARDTVRRARALGIVEGSTLWYDIEAYDTANEVCRESTVHFLSAWTRALHHRDYVSGVYSSAARGIDALDDARVAQPGHLAMPDQVWVAEWVGAADYREPPRATPPTLTSAYLRDDGWLPGGRMRQYRGGHEETHGGVTINIDTNYLDLGRGTRPGRVGNFCGGLQVDFPDYRRAMVGSQSPQVAAAECLLRRKGFFDGPVDETFTAETRRAVRDFTAAHELVVRNRVNRRNWTVLLAEGRGYPVTKIGSGGAAVRRVQRALNAATHAGLTVDGVFGPATTRAVRAYQRGVGVRATGVVAPETWEALLLGAR
jgi:hypothetical protein